ncbi:MAG: ATP-binding protein, partial [Tissierellia bacterium]|nr:ATP-binding protein [Tissierellia bacterium]
EEIYKLNTGKLYYSYEYCNKFDAIIVPIREFRNYKVYCLCCKAKSNYTDRDIAIVDFLVKTTYENTLLDNENVKKRNYLENLFNSVDSFIIGMDMDGKITSANKAFCNFFKMSYKEIIGTYYYNYFPSDIIVKIKYRINKFIEKNNNFIMIMEDTCTQQNRKLLVDLKITPIKNRNGNVDGFVLIGNDMTGKKINDREVEQLKQFAFVGELAAQVAHDIKNPIMNIRGCARILEESLTNLHEELEFIKIIIEQTYRIDEITSQMLSYVSITHNDVNALVDINEIIEKCCDVCSFHKKSKLINIEKKLAPKIPYIKGNNVQLQQAFINIIFNSIESIEQDGIIKISTNVNQEKETLEIIISDNGIGIEKVDLQQIFKPLFTTKSYGTGLGLSIVDRVIKKHHGDILVNSKKDIGTEFIVSFPY